MRATALRGALRVARMLGVLGAALGVSCSRVEPSRTPLSPALARSTAPARPSSSRAVDPSEDNEDRDEMEVVVTPSDDDDGDDSTAPTSSRTSGAKAVAGSPGGAPTGPVTGARGAPLASSSACTPGTGAAPDCTLLADGAGCLGASLARRACETLGAAVEPRVGAAWLACMRDPAKGSACDSHRIVACGLLAVENACVDGSYHRLCGEIATACADMAEQITAPVCEHLIGAWKPDRRSQIVECLHHGCETGGFGVCLP